MLVDNRALIRKLAELDPNKPVYFLCGKDEYVLTAIKPENLDDKVSENEKGIVIDIRETEALEEVVLDREETETPSTTEETEVSIDITEEQEEAVEEETPISEDSTEEAVDTESEKEEESEEKSEEIEKKVVKKSEK